MDRRQTCVMLIWLTLDTVFVILGDSFVSVLGLAWPETESLKDISTIVSKIICATNCCERGVSLLTDLNACIKYKTRIQDMLQVDEQHRNKFRQSNVTEHLDTVNIVMSVVIVTVFIVLYSSLLLLVYVS